MFIPFRPTYRDFPCRCVIAYHPITEAPRPRRKLCGFGCLIHYLPLRKIVRVVRCTWLPPRIPRPSGLNERGAVARVFLIGFDDSEEGTHAGETGEKDEC